MRQRGVIEDLKNHNWKALVTWLGEFNCMILTKDILAGFTEDPNDIQTSDFEILLCLLFAELYKGL